jgi:hypothetical protein
MSKSKHTRPRFRVLPSIADAKSGLRGTRKEWLPDICALTESGIAVDDTMGLQWTPLVRLCARVLAKKARAARERQRSRDGKSYLPRMWQESRGAFHEAKTYDVSRQDPDTFSPFDLCETTYWLNQKDDARGRSLLADCITCVTRAFPRAGRGQQAVAGIGTDDLAALVGTALRQAAEYLDGYCPAIQACSAYPGAILLCAATGQVDAATDVEGRPWLKGDPLTKEGILAWSNPVLRKQIERKLLRRPRAQGM